MTVVVCAALLAIFASLALLASRSKSPTYDEPLHAVGAWLHFHKHDFRVNPEDPPLWHYWAALGTSSSAIAVDLSPPPATLPSTVPTAMPATTTAAAPTAAALHDSALEPGGVGISLDPHDPHTPARRYALVADDIYHEWPFVVDALYPCGRSMPSESSQCPDSDALVQHMRTMMLALGVLLGVVIAWWGWQLGGGMVAVAAIALYCFDPNFLAHAALMKNDVALSLVMASLAMAVWRAGRKLTLLNTAAIALLCAAAVNVKYSGLLLGPIVAILLLLRAIDRTPWETFRRRLERRREKVVAAVAVLAVAAIVSYFAIWACYFFRFNPSPDPNIQLSLKQMMVYTGMAELTAKHGRAPTESEMDEWEPSGTARAIVLLDTVRFLPQAWLNGLLYTYQSALSRQTFLMGNFSKSGWWYYFPMAMLFKTPVAVLIAIAMAIAMLVVHLRRSGWRNPLTWTTACLTVPPGLFLLSAMRSNLNLGLRHVLPVYPFIYVMLAIALAYGWQHWRKWTRIAATVLPLMLAVETLIAFPNFIPFFNFAVGGSKGGLNLLSDSNLDWGQDLKLLAQWQQDHPDAKLYLTYFGMADPWAYGIRYFNFPGGYRFGPEYELSSDPGVLAISATHLQGVYLDDEMRGVYGRLRNTQPIDVLGGSIYLYHWPPRRQ